MNPNSLLSPVESRVNHGTSDPTSFSERTAPELAKLELAYYLVPNPTNPYNFKPFVNEHATKTVYQNPNCKP
jgi:hypothetical protein